MVLSSITGVNTGLTANNVASNVPRVEDSSYKVVKQISNNEIENMMSTEQYVRQYFSDIPIMIQIAKCESTFRQLNSDGEIYRGRVNNADVGVMQINEHYHLDTSEKENYNIYTIEGNTAYARDLYEREGTEPWISSKACWGKYQTAQASGSTQLAMNSK